MNIFELFKEAQKKLKYPKLRYPFKNEILTLSQAGPNSRNFGKIYVTDGKSFGQNKLYAMIVMIKQEEGKDPIPVIEWRDQGHYRGDDYKELQTVISYLALTPIEVAKMTGIKFSYCCFCGTEIVTKESLAAGYGPVCAEKWGLPWGDVPKVDVRAEDL